MVNHLLLSRFAYSPMGTFGVLHLPNQQTVYTVERPWKGNQPSVSCIPEGVYTLRKRESPVVNRTTRGRYLQGWEVTEVPGRTFIMFHPGNTLLDLEGCIAPGLDLGWINNRWAVTASQAAFDQFMVSLDATAQTSYTLDIRHTTAQYP